MRIAVYEILYDDNIENAVSISEAVKLAKKYGDEKAYGFVNGVLAKSLNKGLLWLIFIQSYRLTAI